MWGFRSGCFGAFGGVTLLRSSGVPSCLFGLGPGLIDIAVCLVKTTRNFSDSFTTSSELPLVSNTVILSETLLTFY